MTPRKIQAFFNGKCRVCGKVIAKGSSCWFAKHYGVRCEECGPHTAADAPLPSKRGKKSASRRAEEPKAATPRIDVTDPKGRAALLGSDGVHRYSFDSVTEAVEDALCDYAQNDGNRERIRAIQREGLSGSDKWGHYFTRERFLAELANPSQDLLKAVDEMREQLMGSLDLPTSPRRKVRRGLDWGDELDADRFLSREPNAWERSVREQSPRRTVTIACNVTVAASVKPHELLYRGAAALALADILTQRGLNVGIVLFKSVKEPSRSVNWGCVRYQIKDTTMPLDVGSVAFSMCEIAFSRIVGVCGEARHWPGTLSSGFGHPAEVPAADREGIDYLIDTDCLSRDAAEAWLKEQLESEVVHV